ncbi:MAG: SDR family NAD(P)-dependent oxidoreductase [Lachnospiraceae bacterium]|nr:SDR family NAD(P)-dependent oxidoreductase [Lachnospiraceae bacterium]
MNILLTGGCGFIGTHTAVAFENAGHRVILADNFANSKYEAVKRVRSLVGREVPFYKMDFTDKAAVETLFEKEAIDCVVHFAGLKAVGESVSKPLEYYRNNLDSTLTLLEVMKEHGVKKLIFSSSATVYGQPETCPISEEMPVGDCSNPYGRTKYMIEEIMKWVE